MVWGMPLTDSQAQSAVKAATAALAANASIVSGLDAQVASLTSQLASVNSQLVSLTTANGGLVNQAISLTNDKAGLVAQLATVQASLDAANAALSAAQAQVSSLTTQLADCGSISADLEADLEALYAQLGLTDGGAVSTLDDTAIKAELEDNSLAGIDKRLGAKAPAGMVIPAVYQRPQTVVTPPGARYSYSQDLGAPMDPFDYSSVDGNFLVKSDVVWNGATSTDPVYGNLQADPATAAGLDVWRLRTQFVADGLVSEFATWGDTPAVPDRDANQAIQAFKSNFGHPITATRGKINRYDVGMGLADRGRGGPGGLFTLGTDTAHSYWEQSLPVGFIPISLALSSQNEYAYVGGHNELTGKGQVLVYWMWAGTDLQNIADGKGFPFDFNRALPGLLSSGVITGMKLFAAIDLPIKYPTNIDIVCAPNTTGDRIEGPDGNAEYLSGEDFSTQAGRDSFVARNGGWVSKWGKAAVTSKYESKLVTLDFSTLYAGVFDQYFGSADNYAQTTYAVPPNFWSAFDLVDPTKFPWGIQVKPEWAPVIGTPIDLPSAPSYMKMSEHGDAQIAIATADGFVRFYNFDGTSNGSVKVGDNPVHLAHDKYPGIRSGGLIVTCRASRSILILDSWGPGAKVSDTLVDGNLVDPVATEVGDTHNYDARLLIVCDMGGRQILVYRNTDLHLNQTGATYGIGPLDTNPFLADGTTPNPNLNKALDPTIKWENGGSYTTLGAPFGLTTSNVN